jgi:hypothetical protein
MEDLATRFKAAVTAAEGNRLRRLRDNAMRRAAVCLEMDGGRFEHNCNHEAPLI